jgi:hypothetical protein
MTTRHQQALPAGYEIEGYRFEGVLGSGGFGITYRALEIDLKRRVAIKEFLPKGFAGRDASNQTVHPMSDADTGAFDYGLDRFRDEARTLVNFRHPNIVTVHRLCEANGTAYLVMEYEDGEPLDAILERDGTLPEAEIWEVLGPLLSGLERVHAAGFLHRDIKPGNIYIRRDGVPILIDFGAAREALGEISQTLSAIVTSGYAPFEQYMTKSKQGPSSDIYALGATLYRAITGAKPPESTERMHADTMVPAAVAGKGNYSERLLAAIDWALAVKAEARPQSVAAWRAALEGTAVAPPPPEPPAVQSVDSAQGRGERRPMFADEPDTEPPPGQAPPRAGGVGRLLGWIAVGMLALVALGTGVYGFTLHLEHRAAEAARAESERQIQAQARRRAAAEAKRRTAEEALRRAQAAGGAANTARERRIVEERRRRVEQERRAREEALRRKREGRSGGGRDTGGGKTSGRRGAAAARAHLKGRQIWVSVTARKPSRDYCAILRRAGMRVECDYGYKVPASLHNTIIVECPTFRDDAAATVLKLTGLTGRVRIYDWRKPEKADKCKNYFGIKLRLPK